MDQRTDQSSHSQAALHSRVPGFTETCPDNNTSSLLSNFGMSSGELISKTIDNKSHASASLASDQNHKDKTPVLLFLKLPAELRVQIYRCLLLAPYDICISQVIEAFLPGLESKWPRRRRLKDKFCLGMRTTYSIRADGVDLAILSVNKQIHQEASRILYSENCFNFSGGNKFPDFQTSKVVMPFLKDLSAFCRGLVQQVKFDYSLSEGHVGWSTYSPPVFKKTCNYLCQNLQLKHATLRCRGMSIDGNLGGTDEQNRRILSQQSWIQQLVPLVKNLETFELVDLSGEDEDLTDAVQTYLESKMLKARKTVRRDQVGQGPADGSASCS